MKNLYWLALGIGTIAAAFWFGIKPASSRVGSSGGANGSPVFTDFHGEKPGAVHHITVADLPAPYASESVDAGPQVVARPANAWPQAPNGFKVTQFATRLQNPRLIRTAPNGDVFVAESGAPGRIKVYHGINDKGEPESAHVFASGLTLPFGIAFYPPGPNPKFVYIGNTNAVVRFPYKNGDLEASGPRRRQSCPTFLASGDSAEGATGRATLRFRRTASRCLSPSARVPMSMTPTIIRRNFTGLTFWLPTPTDRTCVFTPGASAIRWASH